MAEGRCNCASIKVSIPEMPKESIICYWYDYVYRFSRGGLLCLLCSANCRRAGSAPGSIIYMFDKSEVTIDDSKGTLKSYRDGDTKSGNTITRQFCSNCGS
jgi:hypothetical protein